MICVAVMYPSGPGKHFDHVYYEQKHRPLVMDRFPRLEMDPELGVLVA